MVNSEEFSYADLALLFSYLEKHCKGNKIKLTLGSDDRKLQVDTYNLAGEMIKIIISCDDAGMMPRIIKEDRLMV